MTAEVVEIQGLEELQQMFKDLPVKLQKKAVKPMLRAAGRVVQRQAVANLSQGLPFPRPETGLLRDSVQVVSLRDKPGYPVTVLIGVPKKSKAIEKKMAQHPNWKYHWQPFYWRFMEYGFTARNGRKVAPRPWLRPALQSVQPQALALMQQYIDRFYQDFKAGAV